MNPTPPAEPRSSSLRDLRLSSVALIECKLEHAREPDPAAPLSYGLDISGDIKFDTERNLVTFVASYALYILAKENDSEDTDEPFAEILFKYRSQYAPPSELVVSPPSEEIAQEFAATLGLPDLEPYAREFVQSMTGRIGLPPLVLSFGPAELDISRAQESS